MAKPIVAIKPAAEPRPSVMLGPPPAAVENDEKLPLPRSSLITPCGAA
jgi:hypothetical protein